MEKGRHVRVEELGVHDAVVAHKDFQCKVKAVEAIACMNGKDAEAICDWLLQGA